MNRLLAIGALLLIPALAVVFYLLGQSGLRPMTGYLAGMAVYWALLALGLWLSAGSWSLVPRAPARPVLLALLALVAAALWTWGGAVTLLSPHVLALVVVTAVLNGFLEEGFWRGALMPDPGPWAQIGACLLLFIAWHLAPAASAVLTGPERIRLLVGAVVIAPFMLAARLSSGTAGTGALAHAAVNIFAFSDLAARHGQPV